MENYRIYFSILIYATVTLQFSTAQSNITSGGNDVNYTAVLPTVSACDGKKQNISEAADQMLKYESCIQPDEGKHAVYPFTCIQYKTMAKCFHEYIESVSSCYAEILPDWQKTDRVLTAVMDYLCDPKTEYLSTYFKNGAKGCVPQDGYGKCAPSVFTVLLNSTKYSVMSKSFLRFNYTKETCSEDEKNARCFIELLDLYCKERPSISEIAHKVQDVIVKESGCDAMNGGFQSLSPDRFVLVLIFTVMSGLILF